MNFKYYKTSALIPFILVLTIVCNIISKKLIEFLQHSTTALQINENIHIFSTLSLITFAIVFINLVGWKWKLFNWLIEIPNLNGRYKGELISSYKDPDGNTIVKDCVLEIKQTASSIKIFSYYGDKGKDLQTSRAFSISEELVQEDNGFFLLYYIFANEPDKLQTQLYNQHTQLHNHAGTSSFKYYPDIQMLDGEYYNQRQNIGTIKVKFEQDKLLGRLVP